MGPILSRHVGPLDGIYSVSQCLYPLSLLTSPLLDILMQIFPILLEFDPNGGRYVSDKQEPKVCTGGLFPALSTGWRDEVFF